MDNKEYYEVIHFHIDELKQFSENLKNMTAKVLGNNLLLIDMCFCAMLDRNICLNNGFIQMLESRNLTCAGAILRLQLDNCMRLFAVYISQDENEVAKCVIDGGQIKNLKDKDGKKMNDGYLKKELSKYEETFEEVYNQTSGYIHFSEKSFFQSVSAGEKSNFMIQVGGERNEKINPFLIECADAFVFFQKFFFNLMEVAIKAKERVDVNLEMGEKIGD